MSLFGWFNALPNLFIDLLVLLNIAPPFTSSILVPSSSQRLGRLTQLCTARRAELSRLPSRTRIF
eukprot:1374295-Heterocapsa_arctica.AAC.1